MVGREDRTTPDQYRCAVRLKPIRLPAEAHDARSLTRSFREAVFLDLALTTYLVRLLRRDAKAPAKASTLAAQSNTTSAEVPRSLAYPLPEPVFGNEPITKPVPVVELLPATESEPEVDVGPPVVMEPLPVVVPVPLLVPLPVLLLVPLPVPPVVVPGPVPDPVPDPVPASAAVPGVVPVPEAVPGVVPVPLPAPSHPTY